MATRLAPQRILGACALVLACAGTPVAARAADPEPVELKTSDGQRIAGFWLAGDSGAPAVLLLHDAGRDHYGFRPLWERLQPKGVHVLALDLRGHGASQRHTPEAYERLVRHDARVFHDMIHDAEAGLVFLTQVQKLPESRIAVVGSEIGCSIGFELMARHPRLNSMVALSPSPLSHGVDVRDALRRYGSRPLLIVTTKKLLRSGPEEIQKQLSKTARVQMELFVGEPVRGLDLLGQRMNVERRIVDWMQGTLLQKR
jgi:pimeloyl-ACP methyl ester carboxylesterase